MHKWCSKRPETLSSGGVKSNVRHSDFSLLRVKNEAVTCRLEIKVLVDMAMVIIINIWVVKLTINENNC